MGTMGVETTNIVLVVIIVIVFFMLMSACCRQLRNAYEDQMTLEELNRRRYAFLHGHPPTTTVHMPYDDSSTSSTPSSALRVTAISAGGADRVFGVYEIRMPPRRSGLFGRVPPPPPFQTALQNSSPIYYIDPEDPPPSYDDYLKGQNNETSNNQNEGNANTTDIIGTGTNPGVDDRKL